MKNIFTILAVCLVFSSNLFAQLPAWVPSNGLMAWYPFTGNALDSSGHKNHGIPYNTTLCPDRFGTSNAAYLFNGVNSRIEVADSQSLRVTKITVSAWIKPQSSYGGCVIYTGNINNAQGERYAFTMNNPWFAFKNNSNCVAAAGWKNSPFNSTMPAATWTFVASTYDGNIERNYVNGHLVNSYTFGVPIDTCAGENLRIGYEWSNNHVAFDGVIDDISIYNRALNDTEVRNLYCGGVITASPGNVNAISGGNASFTVGYVSNGTATYQWQQDAGTGFTNLSNAGTYSGVNTNTLAISSVASSLNNYHYRCIVSPNTDCSDTTGFAVLTIPVTGVKHISNNINIKVSPNPAQNYIQIQVSGLTNTAFQLIDMYGRKLRTGKLLANETTTIDISTIPAGIYYVKTEESNNYVKIVKN